MYESSEGALSGERGPFLMAAAVFHVVVQVRAVNLEPESGPES